MQTFLNISFERPSLPIGQKYLLQQKTDDSYSMRTALLAIQDAWCACDYKPVAVLTPHLIPPGWLRIVTQIE